MSPKPLLAGPIPPEGPAAVLREIERRCTTGVLRFEAEGASGELALARGQVSDVQPGGAEAVEAWLALREGRYALFQRLPPLPVSRGDEATREGRLGVHTPADLMNYCERAGLTGALFLTHEERKADFLYDAGELAAVRLFGEEDGEVQQVFTWDEGGFRVEAWPEMPALPEPHDAGALPAEPPDASGPDAEPAEAALLKVVEVTLSSLLDERAVRTPEPSAGAEPEVRRPARTDPTVRVIYLGPPIAGGRRSLPPSSEQVATPPSPASPVVKPADALDTDPGGPAPLRGDPTIRTREPPMPLEPDSAPGEGAHRHAFFREAGPIWTGALAIALLLLLAAIAHPFLVG